MFFHITKWVLGLGLIVPMYAQSPTPNEDKSARDAFKKGIAAFQQKQFDVAVEALLNVPELGGYLSLYKHWFLGQAYMELGRYKEAEPEFAKVIGGTTSNQLKTQAQFFLGEVALRQKKYLESIKRFEPLVRRWRRSHQLPTLLYRLMEAELKVGRIKKACERARKLYSSFPANGLVSNWGRELREAQVGDRKLPCSETRSDFTARVRNLQWAGESEKAHREITELLENAKESERQQLDLTYANFLVSEGSVEDALNLLIRYYPKLKQNISYLTLLGRAAARSGEYQTAVGAYERAAQLSPNSRQGRESLYQAAYLSYQFQDYDGAVRKFQQFAKRYPRSGLAKDAQWHLAWLQYLRSDYEGAIKRFKEVQRSYRRRKSDSLRDRVLYWTAMAHIRLKQYEEAGEALNTIVSRSPYSFYGLAAEARLETIKSKLKKKDDESQRVPATLKVAANEMASSGPEEEESEEALAEKDEAGEAPTSTEEGVDDEPIQASSFKSPALRKRIDVALDLIALGLNELARWELYEVERRTRNSQYLRMLMGGYEKIGSYHRAASIAELNFARDRENLGLEKGRALWLAMYPLAYSEAVRKHAAQFGVAEEWVWAIMRSESVYRPDVISPVGARGLMQIMPYTARNLFRLADGKVPEEFNLMDPDTNIRLGAQYLARLHRIFKGQLPLVAAAYNAGPHRVEGWLMNFGHLEMDEFIEHIPFLETRNYVKKVIRHHTFYRRLYAKDQKPVTVLAQSLGVPIPSRAATRESWDSL